MSVFLLFRALPIKIYTWEKFWDIWDSVVFSDGRVNGEFSLACSWVPRREIVCPVCLVRLVLTAFTTNSPCLGGGRLRLGSQKFSVLGKVIKCALSLSHGNADNERSLSINKNTLSKERSSLSITALNGLRAVEDGVCKRLRKS